MKLPNIKLLTAGLVMMFIMTTLAFSQHRIATYRIPLMVESKTEGVFIELLQEIKKRIDTTVEVVIRPPKRVMKSFKHDKIVGFFPATKSMISGEFERTDSFIIKKDYAFRRKGDPIIKSIDELVGKKVGLTKGYPYGEELFLKNDIKFQYATTDYQNIKKLLLKRFDVFIVEEASGLRALNEVGSQDIEYDANYPLAEQEVFFAFQANLKGKELAQKFSKAMKKMKEDGAFQRIMDGAQKAIESYAKK